MKSLLITHDFPPAFSGGISVFLHHLCTHLSDVVQVLAPKSGSWETFDSQQSYVVHRQMVSLVPTAFMRKMQVRVWPSVYLACVAVIQFVSYAMRGCRIVIQERVNLVLVGHLYLAPVGWFIQLATSCPYAVILYGSELHRYWHLGIVRRLFIAWLQQAVFLIVDSESTRQQYLARGVKAEQEFVRIYPGADVARFRPEVDAGPLVRRHGVVGRPMVLTVARLVEWKGQDLVIRAMARVVQTVPTAVYILVGEGPYRPMLERLVAELNLLDHVIFAGFVPDEELPRYYVAATVMVLVGREFRSGMPVEGFGIAYIEAGATGRPVIGSRMGGAMEAVADGITGLLVDPDDEEATAKAITRLLTNDELAQKMGRQGRARAVSEFTWEAQAAKLRQQLATIVADRKPA